MAARSNSRLLWVHVVRVAVTAAAIGLTAYWWLRYEGLYRLLATAQLSVFGSYIPLVTFCLVLVVLLLPAIVFVRMAERALGFQPGTTQLPTEEPAIRLNRFVHRNVGFVLAGACLAGGLVSGGYFLGRANLVGRLATESVERLYAGETPESFYVEITGYARTNDRVGVTRRSRGSGLTYIYFPLVPSAGQRETTPRVLVEVLSPAPFARVQALGNPVTLRGVLSRGVSGFVREALRKKGLTVTDDVWVLEEGTSPDELTSLGLALLAGIGGLGVVIGTITALLRARRRARNSAGSRRGGGRQ